LTDCLNEDGDLDDEKFMAFIKSAPSGSFTRRFFEACPPPPDKRRRTKKEIVDHTESTWFKFYVASAPTTKKQLKKKWCGFRLPYHNFLHLAALSRERNWSPMLANLMHCE
jgi:hypothetical protein